MLTALVVGYFVFSFTLIVELISMKQSSIGERDWKYKVKWVVSWVIISLFYPILLLIWWDDDIMSIEENRIKLKERKIQDKQLYGC